MFIYTINPDLLIPSQNNDMSYDIKCYNDKTMNELHYNTI